MIVGLIVAGYAMTIIAGMLAPPRIREEAEMGAAPWVWQVLAKHDPKRVALENMETMQDTNALMRG